MIFSVSFGGVPRDPGGGGPYRRSAMTSCSSFSSRVISAMMRATRFGMGSVESSHGRCVGFGGVGGTGVGGDGAAQGGQGGCVGWSHCPDVAIEGQYVRPGWAGQGLAGHGDGPATLAQAAAAATARHTISCPLPPPPPGATISSAATPQVQRAAASDR